MRRESASLDVAAPSDWRGALLGRLARLVLPAVFGIVPLCWASVASCADSRSLPNIVFIYADDLGYGDLGCYGATRVKTPNVDRLAREGLRFTDAHSPSATCTPSRYAMLTGEYAWRRKGTSILPGNANLIIEPGRTTLASLLKKAGYATGVVGKWHLGLGSGEVDWNNEIRPGPLEIGFDYCFLIPATGDRVPCVYVENRRVVGLDPSDPIQVGYGRPVGNEPTGKLHPELLKVHPSHGHDMTIVNGISRIGYMSGGKSARWVDEDMADTITRKAVDFIDKHRGGGPFFLYFATHDIHVPRVPHPRFVGATGMGPRGDVIAQFDWCTGEILSTLDRLKLADNTLVILSSDNGPVVDDGYRDDAVEKLGGHKPAGPLRGGKYSAFEGGTRVPLLVRWPGRIKPGVSASLVSQIDFSASLAALVGQPVASGDAPDSVNTLPALLGQSPQGRDHLVEHAARLSLRQGTWKYIEPGKGPAVQANTKTETGNSPQPQLYNLDPDLGETGNVAAQHPDLLRQMQTRLQTIRDAGRDRPNIVWITCEDTSPHLGCWGDAYACTPNLDRFASRSVRYTNCYATAPVCSPARACLINGLYATTLGTQHLRSQFPIPQAFEGFPARLRAAGYYCTNNVKTDYNTSNEPDIVRASWDECSNKAHWRNRKPGQPFFAVFNEIVTHQSRMSVMSYEEFQKNIQSHLDPKLWHDPAKAPVPPYWPDTPVTRRTVARFYDCFTLMDQKVGRLLAELEAAGLAEDTIVLFYPDHGSGIPRHKRLVLDTGLRVPLIVHVPAKYRQWAPAEAGQSLDRLVSFVDFAPTVLSLAGLPVPGHMQGEAFLGPAAAKPRQYVYGARDRVDEAYDMARSARDQRYLYVRNYMPHLSYNQPEGYSDQAEVRQEITRLAAEGKLNADQMTYAGPAKAVEELYDSRNDRYQLHNLAGSPAHKPVLERMRQAHRQWVLQTRDLGFLPEWEVRHRSAGSTPYEMARSDGKYPLAKILDTAELVGLPEAVSRQIDLLRDADSSVRYWAAVGLKAAGPKAMPARTALQAALADASPCVRIEAAGALVGLSENAEAIRVLTTELSGGEPEARVQAARTLQLLGPKARPALAAMQAVLHQTGRAKKGAGDVAMYLRFALKPAVERLSAQTE